MPTKSELLKENTKLKSLLNKEQSKQTCYHCQGTGKRWTYGMDNEERCRYCGGSGRL